MSFQFTPLREGRLKCADIRRAEFGISIHAPPRGATTLDTPFSSQSWEFQFTPLREGRRKQRINRVVRTSISIHAPPRGATMAFSRFRNSCSFQFTPLREGRPGDLKTQKSFALFQFTPLREGRRRGCGQGDGCRCISIHAPPRGATHFDFVVIQLRLISIHAPPRGATIMRLVKQGKNVISIHAPPRGATGGQRHNRGIPRNFNSRPSARGDKTGLSRYIFLSISIHAPPRGATSPDSVSRDKSPYFNSRPSARGDDAHSVS